ncbi:MULTISPECIES: hypothetical protein [Enterobacter]|jgi:hypothetical protein|uniref:Uncharacterized protein n=1 Tax=Enterobacter bugandensis TaxID=881260 RepID=A0ABX4VMN3_9ENTR|nr:MULTISPECIES: hypothetical protein [Enterobacter]NUX26831.1 hypothetical protein [Enterobacter bugandensis]NUX49757.1 hypothetical protein [Enterobacter bugandensis]NUX70424.1 hypothetical protein [Enterobacter bugandensis]NUX95970.1 hypothetical protein [Enterobacter bugandensis]NUY21752.1 hypothetical protein [Enterobacter bugandensis]
MPLISDAPELNLSPVVILPNENFMPMLPGGKGPVNPARTYLLSLNSARSWQTMASFFGIVAGMLGAASLSPATEAALGAVSATATNFDSPGHPAMSVSRADVVDIGKVTLIKYLSVRLHALTLSKQKRPHPAAFSS